MPQTFEALTDAELLALPHDSPLNAKLTSEEKNRRLRLLNDRPTQSEQAGQPQGSALSRGISGAWQNLNPVTMAKGVVSAVRHPIQTGGALLSAQMQELLKARDELQQGHYSEAVGHGAAGVLPILGPAAAKAGERAATGDIAGGVGEGVGLLAPFLAGPAARGVKQGTQAAVRGARTLPGGSAALDAVAALADRSANARFVDTVAPKVGPNKTRFGAQAEKVAPKILRDPDLSALSRESLQSKIEAKLEEAGLSLDAASDARLNGRAFDTSQILEQLRGRKKPLTAEAVDGSRMVPEYVGEGGLSADGLSVTPIGDGVSRGGAGSSLGVRSFRASDPRTLFADVLADAQKHGFTEDPSVLRGLLEHNVEQARELVAELSQTHADYGPQALFRAIKKYGGIGDDAGFPGEIADLWESAENATSKVSRQSKASGRIGTHARANTQAGYGGVPGVLKRGGRSLDEMAEVLRQDPQFSHIQGPRELLDAIKESRVQATRPGTKAPTFEDALSIVGVRPGRSWWEGSAAQENAAAVQEARQMVRRGRPLGRDVVPEPNQPRAGKIDKAISEIETLGPMARYDSLRNIRQAYDLEAKQVYSPSMTADYLKQQGGKMGAADVTGVLRDALAEMDPGTAAANAQYALMKTARDVMKATEEVERVRPRVGRAIMARGTGAIAGASSGGGFGAIAGGLVGALVEKATQLAPTMQIVIARRLAAVADFLRSGKATEAEAALRETQGIVRKALQAAGRTSGPTGRMLSPAAALPMAAEDQSGPSPSRAQR